MVNLIRQMASNLAVGFQAMKTRFFKGCKYPFCLKEELESYLCDPEAIPTKQSKT